MPTSTSPGTRVRPSTIRRAIDQSDDEARKVVLAVGVKARASRRSRRRAARTRSRGTPWPCPRRSARPLRAPAGRSPGSREKQRTGALDQDVVDAVVHQVLPHGVVAARHEGELQFGADAVGRCHQHRLVAFALGDAEQPAERPDVGQHVRSEGAFGEGSYTPNRLVARVDIDAGLLVVHSELQHVDDRLDQRPPG